MRHRGTVLKRLDESENMINLCLVGLKNKTITAERVTEMLSTVIQKLSDAAGLVSINKETP